MPMLVSLDRFYCIVHCHRVTSIMCGVPSYCCVQLLVTSIEVNENTLDCGVQPLDLITQFDGKPAEFLCDVLGQCTSLNVKITKCTADVWVARTPGIPSMSLIQSE